MGPGPGDQPPGGRLFQQNYQLAKAEFTDFGVPICTSLIRCSRRPNTRGIPGSIRLYPHYGIGAVLGARSTDVRHAPCASFKGGREYRTSKPNGSRSRRAIATERFTRHFRSLDAAKAIYRVAPSAGFEK
jgi:hypothetical protein